jgi:hypothetical protein
MSGLRNTKTIGWLAALVLFAGAGTALAQPKTQAKAAAKTPAAPAAAVTNNADCTIYEIEASATGNTVDPALKPLSKKLKKAPFSAWKTFKVLKKHSKVVQKMTALRVPLVTGSKMTLLYRDRSGGVENKVRLRLKFTLDDAKDKRKLDSTVNVDSGDHTLIGVDELKDGGMYILGVSCKAL